MFSGPRGSCVLGSRELETKEKTESNLKESFIHCLCCEVSKEAVWELMALLLHCGIC